LIALLLYPTDQAILRNSHQRVTETVRLLQTKHRFSFLIEFETADPPLRGEMTVTITLTDADDGTDILAVRDGLSLGLSTADNETG
jgi:uncharacterized protein YndB with AHSA1/START domain